MMRSFEARGDCFVSDEPLYAHYLKETQIPHPGFDEVVSSQPTDWRTVVQDLRHGNPDGKAIWYQKHMTHHLLPCIDRSWMRDVRHCFLIRSPVDVLSSYARTRHSVTLQDLGFEEQAEIYHYVRETLGQTAPVVDSRDILNDPTAILEKLCLALDVPFTEKMLKWRAGPRSTDGVWAKHWYHSVETSTSFSPYRPRQADYPPQYDPLLKQAQATYQTLWEGRLMPQDVATAPKL
jgi:hypothetical protein